MYLYLPDALCHNAIASACITRANLICCYGRLILTTRGVIGFIMRHDQLVSSPSNTPQCLNEHLEHRWCRKEGTAFVSWRPARGTHVRRAFRDRRSITSAFIRAYGSIAPAEGEARASDTMSLPLQTPRPALLADGTDTRVCLHSRAPS